MATKRERLTDLKVKALKRAPSTDRRDGRYFVMDAEVGGFGVRVTEVGGKTYILRTRYPGGKSPTARELGRPDELDLSAARKKARDWKEMIAKGVDPAEAEEEARRAAAVRRANTVEAVFADFLEEKLAHDRRGKDVARDLRKEFVSPWSARPIADITDQDVLTVIRAKKRTAPSQARNLLGYASRFFDWAIDQRAYGLKANPCAGLKPGKIVGEKRSRDRVLSDDELFACWRAAGRMSYPTGPLYRLLLLTGLRLNEAADARWSEFDFVKAIWTVPAERMKGKDGKAREFVVPITDDIRELLEELPRFKTGDFLFSTTFGKSPAWVTSKVKDRLDERMLRTLKALARKRGEDPNKVELRPFVNHDLRRTLRTNLSALRIDRDVREAVLGHVMKGVEGVYDRYDFLPEKRDALERWAARIQEIVSPRPSVPNVVQLHATGVNR